MFGSEQFRGYLNEVKMNKITEPTTVNIVPIITHPKKTTIVVIIIEVNLFLMSVSKCKLRK